MKCPKCSSNNTQLTAKEMKRNFIFPCILAASGLGLMILSLLGALFGALIGLIVGTILNSTLPSAYETIMVCQSCGCAVKLKNVQNIKSHLLFCPPENSDLLIVRNYETQGALVNLRVWIDNEPFDLANGEHVHLKIGEGFRHLKYEQTNGLGKKNRQGEFSINVQNENQIIFAFTRTGITVNKIKTL